MKKDLRFYLKCAILILGLYSVMLLIYFKQHEPFASYNSSSLLLDNQKLNPGLSMNNYETQFEKYGTLNNINKTNFETPNNGTCVFPELCGNIYKKNKSNPQIELYSQSFMKPNRVNMYESHD